MKPSKSVGLGIIFCLAQSVGESVLAYWFISISGTSNVNLEGMLLYSFIRILLTLIPYILLFWLTYQMKILAMPALIGFAINVIVLPIFYLLGFNQFEPATIMISSLLMSNFFLISNILISSKNTSAQQSS